MTEQKRIEEFKEIVGQITQIYDESLARYLQARSTNFESVINENIKKHLIDTYINAFSFRYNRLCS